MKSFTTTHYGSDKLSKEKELNSDMSIASSSNDYYATTINNIAKG